MSDDDTRSILSDRCDPELLDANPRVDPMAVDPYEIAPPEPTIHLTTKDALELDPLR